jgi:hypothetical protein
MKSTADFSRVETNLQGQIPAGILTVLPGPDYISKCPILFLHLQVYQVVFIAFSKFFELQKVYINLKSCFHMYKSVALLKFS